MLSSIILSLGLAIGAYAHPLVGRYARTIDARAISNETYDFVIAGGGIAGLTVADRLSENPNGMSAPTLPPLRRANSNVQFQY